LLVTDNKRRTVVVVQDREDTWSSLLRLNIHCLTQLSLAQRTGRWSQNEILETTAHSIRTGSLLDWLPRYIRLRKGSWTDQKLKVHKCCGWPWTMMSKMGERFSPFQVKETAQVLAEEIVRVDA